jgi:hypothetical protein
VLVPYPRRRKAEALFRSANLDVDWLPVPSPEAILAKDQERLLEALKPQGEAASEDLDLARALLAASDPEQVIAGLVRDRRARLPAPEDLLDAAPPPRPTRDGFDGSVWFALNLGRRRNADPKWILPLLCRRGGVQRGDVGAIRVFDNETRVQISGAAAAAFERRFTEAPEDGTAIARLDDDAVADPPRRERSPRPDRGARKPYEERPRAEARKPYEERPRAEARTPYVERPRAEADTPDAGPLERRPLSRPRPAPSAPEPAGFQEKPKKPRVDRGSWRPDVQGDGALSPELARTATRPFKEKGPKKGFAPWAAGPAAKPFRPKGPPGAPFKTPDGAVSGPSNPAAKRQSKKLGRGAPPRQKRP